MKKMLFTILAMALAMSLLTSCGVVPTSPSADPESSKAETDFKVVDKNADTEKQSTDNKTTEKSDPGFDIISNNVSLWKSGSYVYAQVAVEVKNTGNVPLYLGSSDFDLEDEAGELVDVMTYVEAYPPIIMPGEIALYFNQTSSDKIANENMALTAIHHIKPEKAKNDQVLLPVTEIKIMDQKYGGMTATARVENTSGEDQSYVYVSVLCKDADGNIITVLRNTTSDISAGEKSGIELRDYYSNSTITADSVINVEAYAFPRKGNY